MKMATSLKAKKRHVSTLYREELKFRTCPGDNILYVGIVWDCHFLCVCHWLLDDFSIHNYQSFYCAFGCNLSEAETISIPKRSPKKQAKCDKEYWEQGKNLKDFN